MGTYAVYRLWAGVKTEDLQDIEHPFIDKIFEEYEKYEPFVEKDGLHFTSIAMHGRSVGIGVEIKELNWEVDISEVNLYDIEISDEAWQVLNKVNEVFRELGIETEAKLYHHIDLGG